MIRIEDKVTTLTNRITDDLVQKIQNISKDLEEMTSEEFRKSLTDSVLSKEIPQEILELPKNLTDFLSSAKGYIESALQVEATNVDTVKKHAENISNALELYVKTLQEIDSTQKSISEDTQANTIEIKNIIE